MLCGVGCGWAWGVGWVGGGPAGAGRAPPRRPAPPRPRARAAARRPATPRRRRGPPPPARRRAARRRRPRAGPPPPAAMNAHDAGRDLCDDLGETLGKLPGMIAHRLLSFFHGSRVEGRNPARIARKVGAGPYLWGGRGGRVISEPFSSSYPNP